MGHDHRVLPHLGLEASGYDRAIRELIPGYDDMLATIVRWLDGHVPPAGRVIDLGSGTGALARAILDGLPTVRVQLVDVDPAMLEVAAARCASHADRIELRRGVFADPLPRCDAVVASLALHHVPGLDEKRALYRAIRDALEPGGLILVGDATVYAGGPERERIFAEWSEAMQRHGITDAQARAHFAQWAGEDHYVPLATELGSLAAAGFPRPECFWKQGPIAVYGAFRD